MTPHINLTLVKSISLRHEKRLTARSHGSTPPFRGGVSGGVLLPIALLTAGWDLPIAAADDGAPVVVDCCQPPQVRPQHIMLLGDNTWNIDNLVWTSWTIASATGTGIEFRDDCVPNCAQGSASYSPVTVTLTGATPPDFHYTSALITNQNTDRSETASLR